MEFTVIFVLDNTFKESSNYTYQRMMKEKEIQNYWEQEYKKYNTGEYYISIIFRIKIDFSCLKKKKKVFIQTNALW